MCFVHGSEEVLFIGTDLEAKVYHLPAQQFRYDCFNCWLSKVINYISRPSSVRLNQPPIGVHSTPDGACLLLSFQVGPQLVLKAYHWETFGSSDGIVIECPDTFTEPLLVTAIVNQANVHVMSLNGITKVCSSLALDITQKVTDSTFSGLGETGPLKRRSLHNCLIDCFEEVWAWLPPLTAMGHQTMLYSHESFPKLVFVVDGEEHHQQVGPHFLEKKHRLQWNTKKSLNRDLKNLEVTLEDFDQFLHSSNWDKCVPCVGEMVVNIVCLVGCLAQLTSI